MVDKITDANGNVIEEIGANVRRQVISKSTSNVIRQIMEYEVGAGTGGGKYAYVSGYRIGGKSGTSEQLNMNRRADGDYKKVASFAAVLPADDPEIIVYVMLDDPNNARTDYSSLLAAPVVGNIISEIAPYLGIAADGEDRSQTVVTVPNLVGTEWSSAQVQLNIKGLRHQLAESTTSQAAAAVTYQYPHAGAKVPTAPPCTCIPIPMRQPYRCAGCDRQERGLCPPDAVCRRIELCGGGQCERHRAGPECRPRFQCAARHRRDHYLWVTRTLSGACAPALPKASFMSGHGKVNLLKNGTLS